jgi:hypothetical protein
MGRQSSYTEETASAICTEIASGRSLNSICKDEGMPHMATVFRWLEVNEAFRDKYARAREAQADALFEQILDIADDGKNDTTIDDDGNIRTDHDVIARSRLRVDARKWMAGKLRPKKYGDRLELAGDENYPIKIETIKRVIVDPKNGT